MAMIWATRGAGDAPRRDRARSVPTMKVISFAHGGEPIASMGRARVYLTSGTVGPLTGKRAKPAARLRASAGMCRWWGLFYSAGRPISKPSERRVNEGLWLGVSDVDDQWPSCHCLAEAGRQRQWRTTQERLVECVAVQRTRLLRNILGLVGDMGAEYLAIALEAHLHRELNAGRRLALRWALPAAAQRLVDLGQRGELSLRGDWSWRLAEGWCGSEAEQQGERDEWVMDDHRLQHARDRMVADVRRVRQLGSRTVINGFAAARVVLRVHLREPSVRS
jgi:hypothetical protein